MWRSYIVSSGTHKKVISVGDFTYLSPIEEIIVRVCYSFICPSVNALGAPRKNCFSGHELLDVKNGGA